MMIETQTNNREDAMTIDTTNVCYQEMQNKLSDQSAALIELAAELERYQGKEETWIRITVDSIRNGIASAAVQRERTLELFEKQVIQNNRRAEANQKLRAVLQSIVDQLPADLSASIQTDPYGEPFIRGGKFSLEIKNCYSSNWKSTPIGLKLVASAAYESRSFPQKKDGTFSVDKAVNYVREQLSAKAARDAQRSSDAARLERFKALVQPFIEREGGYEFGVYRTELTFRVSNTFELTVKRTYGEEDQYIVQRTVTETVTPAQLAQILKNEVGEAKRSTEKVES
jgi:hypothetical protein